MLLLSFLQIVAPTTNISENIFLDYLQENIFYSLFLILLFVIVLYLFVVKLIYVNNAEVNPANFMKKINNLVLEGDIKAAQLICIQTKVPVSRIIEKGLLKIGNPIKVIENAIDFEIKIEINQLKTRLNLLYTLVGSLPILGLIVAMINLIVFFSKSGSNIEFGKDISMALITVTIGIILGTISYLLYNYLVSRINKLIFQFEYSKGLFFDLLLDTKK